MAATLINPIIVTGEGAYKECTSCKNILAIVNFYQKLSRGHYTSICKTCHKNDEHSRRCHIDNIEKNSDRCKTYYNANKDRLRAEDRAYSKTPEGALMHRNRGLKKRYGIDQIHYLEMLASQNGTCAICHKSADSTKRGLLFVDHCHKTGKVRKLLCPKCNVVIGNADDNISILLSAIEYLKEHNNEG